MLKLTLPTKRKVVVTTHTTYQPSNQEKVVNQFNQKDLLIKEEFKKATYKKGDIVRPIRQEDFEHFGWGVCRGIVSQYKDWPIEEPFPEPPKKPMIVLVESLKTASAYNCTVNYVRAATPEEKELLKNEQN